MTKNSDFKKRVRALAAELGVPYAEARTRLQAAARDSYSRSLAQQAKDKGAVRQIAADAVREQRGGSAPETLISVETWYDFGVVVHVHSETDADSVRTALAAGGFQVDTWQVSQPDYGVRIHAASPEQRELLVADQAPPE